MFENLALSPLFAGLESEDIEVLLNMARCEMRQYVSDDMISLSGTPYKSLLIVAEGSVRYETSGTNGGAKIERIAAPAVIVPAVLYAPDNRMPVHVVANEPTSVLVIHRSMLSAILQEDRQLLENFLGMISDPRKSLSDKVLYLGFKTMKGKFAHLVLAQAEQEQSDTFRLKLTQREMAELFGVTRPALARAIREMSDEGAIYVDRKNIRILYPEKLKQYIKE